MVSNGVIGAICSDKLIVSNESLGPFVADMWPDLSEGVC